jgi:hypothetical protein
VERCGETTCGWGGAVSKEKKAAGSERDVDRLSGSKKKGNESGICDLTRGRWLNVSWDSN